MTDDDHHHHQAWTDLARRFDEHAEHRGAEVQVGPYRIGAAGSRFLRPEDLDGYDLLVCLACEHLPMRFGRRYTVLAGPLPDFGGVPETWAAFVGEVADELRAGKRLLAFCVGSHGRTGCLLGSLIALLEPETADPIAAVRARHCSAAVETAAQAAAVFAIRGDPLPLLYTREFGTGGSR